MLTAKAALRRQIRAAYPGPEQRALESRSLCEKFLSSELWLSARTVVGYVPLPREADVTPLLQACLKEGRRLLLPRVEGPGEMTLRLISSLDELTPGSYGIPEPGVSSPIVPPAESDLILVPLEAVDRNGMRLGKGGGYYDRLLSGVSCASIGIVMSWQWTEAVPSDPWDRPLTGAADKDGLHLFSSSAPRTVIPSSQNERN